MMSNINVYDLADTRVRLMEKYQKGIISVEEMILLDAIERQVDMIVKQRKDAAR